MYKLFMPIMKNKFVSLKLLTLKQAASILHVNPETLRRWDRQGRLKAIRVGTRQNKGDRRYRLEDIENIRKEKEGKNPLASKEPSLTSYSKPLQFSTKQKRIWQYLIDVDKKAASAYAGAIRVQEDDINPDRIAQSAHSLRELNTIIIPYSKPESKDNVKDSHLKRILKYMKSQDLLGGLPEEIAIKTAQQWVDMYKWFCSVAHHGKEPKQEEFKSYLQILENIIESQIGPFYNSIGKIDRLLQKKRINSLDVRLFKSVVKKRAHYEYFFQNLSNPAWLSILMKEGYFMSPPASEKTDEGGIRFPLWEEAKFLIKIADQKPREVCDVILNSRPTDNPWVHEDFLEAAKKMPVDFGSKLVRKIQKEKWFNDFFISRPAEKASDLMIKLGSEGKEDEAFQLASEILEVESVDKKNIFGKKNSSKLHEAKSVIDEWKYGEILEKKLPSLTDINPLRTIQLLRGIFEKVIRFESNRKGYDDGFINHYRSAIEENEHNWAKDKLVNLLITALRNNLEQIAKNKPEKLKDTVLALGHDDGIYPVLLRVQMYIFRKFPKIFDEEIVKILSNKEYFYMTKLTHEYSPLLKESFPNLIDEIQNKIFEWIEEGPISRNLNKNQLEYWQVQKLAVIEESLDSNWKKRYQALIKTHKPEPSEFGEGPITTSWVGPTSPISEQELQAKPIEEIIQYLTNWTPKKDFMAPSPDGLGRVFEIVVAKQPSEYMQQFKRLYSNKIRPVYFYHLITGIKNAYNQGAKIKWEELLEILLVLTKNFNPYDYPKDEGFYDTNWSGVRKSITDLLEEILKKNSNELPFDYQDKVWAVIKNLSKDPDPDLEYEKKYNTDNMDPTGLSINTVRGDTFHAIILYALWVSRHLFPDEKKRFLAPEVKEILETHLNPSLEPTQTIRSIYGQYFPTLYYLNKNWVNDHYRKIFYPFENKLSQAAWNAYLGFANFWVPAANFLLPLYEESVNHLNKDEKGDKANNRLAEHLMILYWRGDIKLIDNIMVNFSKNSPVSMKGHAVWFLWRSMEEAKLQKNSIEWKRLKEYWKKRLDEISSDEKTEDISYFADWLNCVPEDINELNTLIKATIPHLSRGSDVGYMIGYLKKNLSINIELVSDLLYNIVKINPEDIKYRLHDDDISQILTVSIKSDSIKARDYANKTINLFGDRGNHSFRNILALG